jgi:hypothetical protein
MSPSLEAFMDQHLPLPGVAAWSARRTEQSLGSHCFYNWLQPAQVEQTLADVESAARSLGNHQIEPVRLCWVFEHVRIHLALRSDGACLAVFVENRPDLTSGGLENMLSGFDALQLD